MPRVRADAGYFTGDLANAAVEAGGDFAIAAKRNTAMWRANAGIDEDDWVDAKGMAGAQVAAVATRREVSGPIRRDSRFRERCSIP